MSTRKSKKSATEIDITKPVPYADSMNDCLGNEYDPRVKECQACHDSTYCSILFQQTVTKRVEEVEKVNPMLDKDILPGMDDEFSLKLVRIAKKYHEQGSPMTQEEAAQALIQQYGLSDTVSATLWVSRWEIHHNLKGTISHE